MKRSTKHIKKVLAYIEKTWKKYPDLRLCQLISNVLNVSDPFYVEDGVLVVGLKKYYKFWDKNGDAKVWADADFL